MLYNNISCFTIVAYAGQTTYLPGKEFDLGAISLQSLPS